MIWSSPSIIFWCESSGNGDYVIQRPHCHNIWYGHHQASFFSVNPTVTVIKSSGDHIVIIYDMVIFSESSVVMVTVSSGNYILVIHIWYNLRLTILNNFCVWFVCISGYYNLTTYSHSAVFQKRWGAVIRRDPFLVLDLHLDDVDGINDSTLRVVVLAVKISTMICHENGEQGGG